MPYTQLYYHLVWATAGRAPLITPELEPVIHKLIVTKALKLGGRVFALDGMPDHRHLVGTIPSKVAVATFVGQVKGVTSTAINKQQLSPITFTWQDEYGAFSIDAKRLPNYLAYVRQQKTHHAHGTVIPVLERIDDGDYIVRDEEPLYLGEDPVWRREMEELSSLMR